MAYLGRQWTISGTATSITSAMGLSAPLKARYIMVGNITGATAALFVGNSGVTTTTNRGAEIAAGAAKTFESQVQNSISTDEIYLIGTANAANIALISVVT